MNSTQEIPSKKEENTQSSALECNICCEDAHEPVATNCGHIYCWSCIYKWIQTKKDQAPCPVCNNIIREDKIIPLYTKNSKSNAKPGEEIPKRPQPQREERKENTSNRNNRGNSRFDFSTMFNSMFANININANNMRINVAFPTIIPLAIFFLFNLLSSFLGSGLSSSEETYYSHNSRNFQQNTQSNTQYRSSSARKNSSTTSAGPGFDYTIIIALFTFVALSYLIKRLRR